MKADTYGVPITRFSGKYRFLSNFWPAPVRLDGQLYPSVEHAYQAAKFPADDIRRVVLRDSTLRAGKAKGIGRGQAPVGWKDKSLSVMFNLLWQKFSANDMKNLLLLTGSEQLVEGNNWHDVFYGVCDGNCNRGPHKPTGDNNLGKLLMRVREELQREQAKGEPHER